MTLNQILTRLRTIVLAHKQIRRFVTGAESDFFTDHTAKYPACCLQYTGATVGIAESGVLIVTFRMYILDLVHVSQDTKANEDEVLSDTLSIFLDLIAQINNSVYNDWKLSVDNQLQAVVEYDGDMSAGWYLDFTIRTPFAQNVCEIPSDLDLVNPTDMADKLVYDKVYHATGNEGLTITTGGVNPNVPEINGKKLLLITREQSPIYKVSSNPDSAEFTWDNSLVGLGAVTNPNERFLFLYRNY